MQATEPADESIAHTRKSQKKRLALVSAATQCFIKYGYDNTTAKTIADCAGVATGTFYQYFENKEDMLRVIAQRRMDELDQQLPPFQETIAQNSSPAANKSDASATRAVFSQVLALIYDFHEQAPELHQVLEQRRELDEELAAILDQGETLLYERVLSFVRSFNTSDPEGVAFNLFAMAEGLVHKHVFGQPTQSKQATLQLGAAMLSSYFDNLTY